MFHVKHYYKKDVDNLVEKQTKTQDIDYRIIELNNDF